MKKYLAVLAALTIATPLAAQTSFGVRGGMTLSTLAASEEDEEIEVSYLTGFHLGVTASLWSGGPGLLLSAAYAQRGTALSVDISGGLDSGESIGVSVDLAYIDVGAFGRIPVGTGPYLLVGPTLGLRVACSTSYSAEGVNETADCGDIEDNPYKTFDFGVSGGAGVSFGVGGRDVVVEALYGFGILNIVDVGDDTVRNRGFTFRAGVDFGL